MDGQSGANTNGADNAQDKNESNKRYITGGRRRSEGNVSRDFSAQNTEQVPRFFAAAMQNNAPARTVDRSKLWKILGIVAAIAVLVVIIVIAIVNIFNRSIGNKLSEKEFRDRIYYRDEMNCEATYYNLGKERKFSIVANDGWKNAEIKGVLLDDVLVDITIYDDDVYVWRFDSYDNENRKMNHSDSVIYKYEDFEVIKNYDIRNKLSSLGNGIKDREIRCKTLDDYVFKKPDDNLFNDQRLIVRNKND